MPTTRDLRLIGAGLAALAALAACGDPVGGGVFGNAGGAGGTSDVSSFVGAGGDGGGGAGDARSSASVSSSGGQGGDPTPASSAISSVSSASGGCVTGVEYTCLSGQCIPLTWQCDGLADCGDGSDEAPLNLTCSSVVSSVVSSSASTGGNGDWTCNQGFYGTGDGCDCGCGTLDPDCPSPSVDACQFCDGEGSCAQSCEQIRPDQNWRCNGGGG